MTAAEAIAYIENYTWSATRLGLGRTKALLAALGDPQKQLRFIHTAGSNGKGSTCAMLDSILRAAGYRVGLYTSPYIQDFCERMRVDGENISGEKLAAITARVRVAADAMEDHPSQFELVTAIAMVYFLEEQCDIVVLEVGMGGELDSTNAIDAPEVAIITNIGLEHTEYLGNTLEEIARTKAGIIKPGCHVVCYDGATEVTRVVREVCAERDVPFRLADSSRITPLSHDLDGQRFQYDEETFFLPLLGEHQLYNAAVALKTVGVLRRRGWRLDTESVRRGLEQVRWPARFEVLSRDPILILDGGHNPQCAEAMGHLLADYLPGEKVTFLMGVLADKNYKVMLDALAPYAASFVCVAPESPRALPADALAAEAERRGLPAVSCGSIEDGIRTALEQGRPVVACGSLYMAGHIRTAFSGCVKPFQRRRCLERRRALTEEQRSEFSQVICRELAGLPEVRDAGTILSYMAAWDEVDLTGFHRWAAEQGKTMAFPVAGPDGEMTAMIPEGPDCWETGRFGIRCPAAGRSVPVEPDQIDLVIVPCVGFDGGGARLGRSGGYYDRYLPRCARARAVLCAFEAQRLERTACEAHDAAAGTVATEAGVFRA